MMSLNILLTENGRLRFHDLTCVFGDFEALAKQLESSDSKRAPTPMNRIPRKKYIGPIADGPSSPWFRNVLGADYAWWQEQVRQVPQFELLVYEAGNFADSKRSLAEIEDAVAAEYGELPQGFIEGMFDRLAKIGLVEWVEKK